MKGKMAVFKIAVAAAIGIAFFFWGTGSSGQKQTDENIKEVETTAEIVQKELPVGKTEEELSQTILLHGL